MKERNNIAKCPDYIEASYFVQPDIYPADDLTRDRVQSICRAIELAPNKANGKAVASFLQACQALEHREPYFSWLYRNGGPVASQDRARKALIAHGYFELKYHGYNYWWDSQAAIYKLSTRAEGLAEGCAFACSKPSKPVKINYRVGDTPDKELEQSIAYKLVCQEVSEINDFLSTHPFTIHGTSYFGGLRRTFNRGSLKSGGRFYPGYVTIPKKIMTEGGETIEPRKAATIDGALVAEVDLKAAFLSILAAQRGCWWSKGESDPYQRIRFVAERLPDARDFAKILVSSIIMKDGDLKDVPTKLTRYKPLKGEEVRRFPELLAVYQGKELIGQVHEAFPFLSDPFNGQEVVFWESEVIAKTVWNAAQIGVPAYPLHDGLFVKQGDANRVKRLLEGVFRDLLGYTPQVSTK